MLYGDAAMGRSPGAVRAPGAARAVGAKVLAPTLKRSESEWEPGTSGRKMPGPDSESEWARGAPAKSRPNLGAVDSE